MADTIMVEFFGRPGHPELIADWDTWPFSAESFAKIEKWTGILADEAEATL